VLVLVLVMELVLVLVHSGCSLIPFFCDNKGYAYISNPNSGYSTPTHFHLLEAFPLIRHLLVLVLCLHHCDTMVVYTMVLCCCNRSDHYDSRNLYHSTHEIRHLLGLLGWLGLLGLVMVLGCLLEVHHYDSNHNRNEIH